MDFVLLVLFVIKKLVVIPEVAASETGGAKTSQTDLLCLAFGPSGAMEGRAATCWRGVVRAKRLPAHVRRDRKGFLP